VAEAKAEGIEILHRWGVKQIMNQGGQVTGLELKAVARVFDEQGRFAPAYIEAKTASREADVVIMAIGQKANLKFITEADGIHLTPRGLIQADPDTLATSREGVFAGGDVVTGPWIAIGAVAAGREAAISIDRYLQGQDLKAHREAPLRPIKDGNWNPIPPDLPQARRESMPELPQTEWTAGFKEINLGFTEAQARQEAERCINCGACSECMQCVEACKAGAIAHEQQPQTQTLEVGALILAPGFKTFDAKLKPE
jgi:NADPH-dependent glutamate synthase beta subunit-like oxidoreductase